MKTELKEQKKWYVAPDVTVVKFKAEAGFGNSNGYAPRTGNNGYSSTDAGNENQAFGGSTWTDGDGSSYGTNAWNE